MWDTPRPDQYFHRMAFNPALGTAATITPQGGAYQWPTAVFQPVVASSNAVDAAAGTGARTIRVSYLDGDYAEQSEIVTLNGTTNVTMAAEDVLRIQDVRVVTAGSGGVTAGNITVKNADATVGYIGAGYNCNRQGVFTVPAGRRLFIVGVKLSATHTASNKRAILAITRRTGAIFNTLWEAAMPDGAFEESFSFPLILPEKTDFFCRGVSDGTATVHMFIEGWLGDK